MNLTERRSARLREDFVMRLGCVLVSLAVLASLVLEPPKAKAFAMTSSAVTALAGGFLNACGLAPVVSGMSSSGEVNESLARLIQEYLDAEVPGVEIVDWLGDLSLKVNSGNKLVIPAAAAGALSAFAQWVAGKYGTKPGVNVVYSNTDSYPCMVGEGASITWNYPSFATFKVSKRILSNWDVNFYLTEPGEYVVYKPNVSFVESGNYFYPSYIGVHTQVAFVDERDDGTYSYFSISESDLSSGSIRVNFTFKWAGSDFTAPIGASYPIAFPIEYFAYADSVSSSLALDVAATMQEVLDRLTALEEGQSIALDVGATQSMEIQEILQGILDAILAGDLAARAEIVDEATEPVDPDPPVVPVVPEGLDKLGAALTSRFPFSIPWDVYKGVTLLAAPPKAPYFEVDFMAPIADRVGGWQGSTKIVLDFSEYEIIGQVCRWTSTIGFCLMLAVGTKRLIWTA